MNNRLSLGDDFEVMCTDKVKIKTSNEVVHILENVVYASKIQKNLISLNLLYYQGYIKSCTVYNKIQ